MKLIDLFCQEGAELLEPSSALSHSLWSCAGFTLVLCSADCRAPPGPQGCLVSSSSAWLLAVFVNNTSNDLCLHLFLYLLTYSQGTQGCPGKHPSSGLWGVFKTDEPLVAVGMSLLSIQLAGGFYFSLSKARGSLWCAQSCDRAAPSLPLAGSPILH